jgi:hypothetical protein
MRFAVDTWDPSYGTGGGESGPPTSEVPTRIDAEVPVADWAARDAPDGTAAVSPVVFVDGVRRVEARLWITEADGTVRAGIAASYAAGAVLCNGAARVASANVERRLFTTAASAADVATRHGTFLARPATGDSPEELSLALQQAMGRLEVDVAREAAGEAGGGLARPLVMVDGPLRQHGHQAGTVGSIKTQHRSYGPPVVQATAAALRPGQRTPVFLIGDRFSRWSWYLRLPGPVAHPMAGIVRCEAPGDLTVSEAAAEADRVTATLPRYASEAHKDTRAPQNLYPIGGLERQLRHRLGDASLMLRALRAAAS